MKLHPARKIQFSKFRHYGFNINGPKPKGEDTCCGSWALACVTGFPTRYILKHRPKHFWTDHSVIKFLRWHGFKIIPITIAGRERANETRIQINKFNVLLVSQHVTPAEGTWSVVHNNFYYHSGDVNALQPYEFLNWPIWSVHLLWHPEWKKAESLSLPNMLMAESYKQQIDAQTVQHSIINLSLIANVQNEIRIPMKRGQLWK